MLQLRQLGDFACNRCARMFMKAEYQQSCQGFAQGPAKTLCPVAYCNPSTSSIRTLSFSFQKGSGFGVPVTPHSQSWYDTSGPRSHKERLQLFKLGRLQGLQAGRKGRRMMTAESVKAIHAKDPACFIEQRT